MDHREIEQAAIVYALDASVAKQRERLARVKLGEPGTRPGTRDEAELRVLLALATIRTPGVCRLPHLGAKSTMPDYVHDEQDIAWQQELQDMDAIETFRPTRRDLSDWLCALGWFAAADPPEKRHARRKAWSLNKHQRIIKWRSYGLQDGTTFSWRWIAEEIGQSHITARNWYENGIDAVWRAAKRTSMS